MGLQTVTGNAVEGTPYVARILNNGSPDYVFWQTNTTDGRVNVEKISSDNYGNSYVAGNYIGTASAIDGTNLPQPNPAGLFLGKYAYVKTISGIVRNETGDFISDGYVKLFGCTRYQRSPLNDSVSLGANGSFEFIDIPAGRYMLVAFPTGPGSEIYIPTYYPSAEYWEFTEYFEITPNSSYGPFNITIQQKSDLSGITALDGNVSENDETKSLKTSSHDKAKPSKKATVVLAGNKRQEKSTYEIVATTLTDDDGNFAFFSVDNGTYHLWVDIPGLPCEPVYVIEIDGNQYVSNLNYLVNEEVVAAEGFPEYDAIDPALDESGVMLYPNPARDNLSIILPFDNGIADLFDSNGRYIRRYKLVRTENRIDISDISPGNYSMRIYYNHSVVFRRITITPFADK